MPAPALLLLAVLGQVGPLPAVTDDFQPNEPAWVRLACDPKFVALFEVRSHTYTGGDYRDRVFRYRLFVPSTSGPEDKRPLLVWLHGVSTSGDDNITQLRHLSTLVFPAPWEHARYPFFLLAIQCPQDNRHWSGGRGLGHFAAPGEENVPIPLVQREHAGADDMLHVLEEILDKTLAEERIDPDRVSLTGVSSGGSGAWEFALRRPELFSCLAPIASGGAGKSRASNLAKIPVWAFQSHDEPGHALERARESIAAINSVGGNAYLTEVDSRSHGCWNEAFLDYDLLDWLLGQQRGRPLVQPIGQISVSSHVRVLWRSLARRWTLTQFLTQLAIPIVLLLAFWSVRRRNRMRSRRET